MRKWMLAAALALVAPVTLAAQTPPGMGPRGDGPRGPGGRSPVELILNQRAELELSADQVTRLEAIRQRLESEQATLIERLRAARGERDTDRTPLWMRSAEERAQVERQRAELRPLVEQMRDNVHEAGVQAFAVLTAEQQQELRGLAAQRRDGMRDRMREGRPGRMNRRPTGQS